ncbi:MAG: cation:dicarboxylase symporter family transporter, partial [Pseudomonadota bacterium]
MGWWFKIDLWKRVIVALVLGLALGLGMRYGMGAEAGGSFAETWIGWAGDLFLRLIRMLIVPLVFFTLVSGIIAMGDPKRLGSLGVRTIGTYLCTTAIAVTLGLIMATIFQPGASLSPETFAGADTSRMESVAERAADAGGIVDRLLNIVPTNPVDALATG